MGAFNSILDIEKEPDQEDFQLTNQNEQSHIQPTVTKIYNQQQLVMHKINNEELIDSGVENLYKNESIVVNSVECQDFPVKTQEPSQQFSKSQDNTVKTNLSQFSLLPKSNQNSIFLDKSESVFDLNAILRRQQAIVDEQNKQYTSIYSQKNNTQIKINYNDDDIDVQFVSMQNNSDEIIEQDDNSSTRSVLPDIYVKPDISPYTITYKLAMQQFFRK